MAAVDKISSFTVRNPVQLTRQIGQRLKTHRLARGWTQAELAERSGVSLSTLKLLESQGKGSLQRLAKVAVVLDLDGQLRELFVGPPAYADHEAVERASRQRASTRRRR